MVLVLQETIKMLMSKEKIEDILHDYYNCSKFADCTECRCNKVFNTSFENYCELLRKNNALIEEKINKALAE